MAPQRITLDVFGRLMLAEHTAAGWQLFAVSHDGKRSLVRDVAIPDFIPESGLEQYLADVFHESATPTHPRVRRLVE
jgi:hypothetical protein